MKFKITESIDWDNVQWGVHQFSTESIIFRGTEEECQKYIDERPELWDDAEVYFMTPDDPHYQKNEAYRSGDRYYGGLPADPDYRPEKPARYWKEVTQYFIDTVATRPEYKISGRSPITIVLETPEGKEHIDLHKFDTLTDAEEAIEMASHYFDASHPLTEDMKYYPQDYDEIELEYKKLDLGDSIISWTYEVDKKDVYTFIFESCIDVEDYPRAFEDDFDPNTEEDWNSYIVWLEDNFDEIFTKYEDKILDHWREAAIEDAEENYEYDPIDYDAEHDDYRFEEDWRDSHAPSTYKSEPEYREAIRRAQEIIPGYVRNILFNNSKRSGVRTTDIDKLSIHSLRRIYEAIRREFIRDNYVDRLSDDIINLFELDNDTYLYYESTEGEDMKFKVMNERYEPGQYGDIIFQLLDKMPADQVHACLIESEYDKILGTTPDTPMSDVYTKIGAFLDIDSGVGLYKALDRYCGYHKIIESKEEKICCICKQPYEGYGNNAEPVCSGTCCDKCNIETVLKKRIEMIQDNKVEGALLETNEFGEDEIDANCEKCAAVVKVPADFFDEEFDADGNPVVKEVLCATCREKNESLSEALTDYKITYYLATATKERRPETREDIDNDYKEIHVDANDDFDALSKAFMIQRHIDDSDLAFELDEYDIKNEEDFVRYFNDTDWGDGSILMLKVEGPNGVLYDTGYNKQTFIDELEDNIAQDKAMLADMEKEDPEMAARFRELLGITESVESECNDCEESNDVVENIDDDYSFDDMITEEKEINRFRHMYGVED